MSRTWLIEANRSVKRSVGPTACLSRRGPGEHHFSQSSRSPEPYGTGRLWPWFDHPVDRSYTGNTSTREVSRMIFNVAQLLREPVGETRDYTLPPEFPLHGGRARLIRVPDGVLVQVEADVVLDAACSRCLAPFGYPAHIEFEETYVQIVDVVTGQRRREHLEEGDERFVIDTHHTIDISEAVRQYSEMAAAMQPLCRSDCPGICPECGRDLSITSCDCDRAPVDPRWAALAALRTPAK